VCVTGNKRYFSIELHSHGWELQIKNVFDKKITTFASNLAVRKESSEVTYLQIYIFTSGTCKLHIYISTDDVICKLHIYIFTYKRVSGLLHVCKSVTENLHM